jgi:hypothetical protein
MFYDDLTCNEVRNCTDWHDGSVHVQAQVYYYVLKRIRRPIPILKLAALRSIANCGTGLIVQRNVDTQIHLLLNIGINGGLYKSITERSELSWKERIGFGRWLICTGKGESMRCAYGGTSALPTNKDKTALYLWGLPGVRKTSMIQYLTGKELADVYNPQPGPFAFEDLVDKKFSIVAFEEFELDIWKNGGNFGHVVIYCYIYYYFSVSLWTCSVLYH